MRHWRISALTAVLAVLLAACDWPMLDYGPAHTSASPDISIDRAAAQRGLVLAWTGPVGSATNPLSSPPVIAHGVAYVGTSEGRLVAFSAAATSACTGTPTTCQPLWTGAVGGAAETPAVANGVVYVSNGSSGKLEAFDAAGITNCSGTPKVCQPLWISSPTGAGPHGQALITEPTVANGRVYVGSFDGIWVFDAAGTTNCSGSPKVCQPLWIDVTFLAFGGSVANGMLYANALGSVAVFDANGVTNCSGATPKSCGALWSAPIPDAALGNQISGLPAVANGRVYVGTQMGPLAVYDAAGTTNCTAGTCQPLWTTATAAATGSPAVTGSVFYVPTFSAAGSTVNAYDAAGTAGCSGTPVVCQPLWSTTGPAGNAAVANAVLYTDHGTVDLYDATGFTGCSGTPTTCSPLSSITVPDTVAFDVAITDGMVYVATNRQLYAYRAT